MSLIRTPFDFASTAAAVVAGIDLRGRRAVVTGAASGIGVETARALASTGAEVTLAVRDVTSGARIAAEISAATGNAAAHAAPLDLADLGSVTGFVDAWDGPLHILVNNAGVMACPEQYTPDGWELQFATNHPWLAYGQSKTANVLFAVEATKRWAGDGVTANALTPGAIYTNLQRHTGGVGSGRTPSELFKTVEQGAATSVLLAVSPQLTGVGGRYFADCNETDTIDRRRNDLTGVARYALDPVNAERLWNLTEAILTEVTR